MIFEQPEFYDIFGLLVFFFITVISIWALKMKKPLPRWGLILLLIIGVLGLIVDGSIVYRTFIYG
ncbi:MAG: hypothetical protein AABW87_02330, partial [Nanoarchaeota archaeon]